VSARRQIGSLARRGLRASAIAYDRLAPPPPGAVILAYHQVGGPRPGAVNLTPAVFDDQLAVLAAGRRACPLVGLDDVVARVQPGVEAEAAVSVTFDDGTADFVDHALPLLVHHDIPVTLYLATAHVDAGRSFWDDGTVLSWAALRDACATGIVTIGSHTHDHILLDRTDADRVAADLDRSIGRIEDELGVRPTHFAYPKALAPSPAVKPLVRERFASAALAGGRPNRPGRTDLWGLDRTPVVAADTLADVVRKAAGGLRLEATARSAVDRVRYRGASR